jgi:hypothetical protein
LAYQERQFTIGKMKWFAYCTYVEEGDDANKDSALI